MEIHSSPGVEKPSPSQSAGEKNLRLVTAPESENLSKQLSMCSPWKSTTWRQMLKMNAEDECPSLSLLHQEESLSTRASVRKCGSVPLKSFMVARCWECSWPHGSPGFLRPLTYPPIFSHAAFLFAPTTCSRFHGLLL